MSRFVLSLVLMLCAPLTAKASDCYFLVGYGTGDYRRNYTEKLEERILNSDYVDGDYTVNRHSHPYQIGGGCSLGRYIGIEVDYFQGLRTEVMTNASLCVNNSVERVCTRTVSIRRLATLEGWELSFLGRLPISKHWSITGRFGALSGAARVMVTIPSESMTIGLVAEKRGTIPIVGLGIMYRPLPSFSFSLEHKRFDGKSSINQFVGRWYL
ncbi:MAG: hypothetical protein WAT81_02050 [Candidatus Moraniibacteriota bacterium]